VTTALAGAISFVGQAAELPSDIILAMMAGCFIGLFIHPDLDQAEINIRKRPWLIYWWLYGKLIPHRSTFSHGPLVGTIGRTIYAAPVVAAIAHTTSVSVPNDIAAATLFGLAAADACHYVADQISTSFKELTRPMRKFFRRMRR